MTKLGLKLILAIGMIFIYHFAHAEDYVVKSQTYRVVTAYNVGDVNQCDSDPCIDAANTNICKALEKGERRCAANFVPKWTVLEIDGYGQCVVTDRTNRRYRNRVDIAMKKHEYKKALTWGRKTLMVKILKKQK